LRGHERTGTERRVRERLAFLSSFERGESYVARWEG
jgi:hypothetical protein